MKPFNPNGAVIYNGPSALDGAPIVAIVTGLAQSSRNTKTGDMLQTWIMRADLHPVEALKGADISVCGLCPHRPAVDGDCYVQVGKAPSGIWKAFKRSRYATLDSAGITAAGAGRVVRLGSYGDPAAVPLEVWQAFTTQAEAWTGYTHQWREALHLVDLCMASADSLAEAIEARAMGWRTFRVRTAQETVAPRLEFVCPASAEAGRRTDCASCRACMGQGGKAKASPVIIAHGARAKRFRLTLNGEALAA